MNDHNPAAVARDNVINPTDIWSGQVVKPGITLIETMNFMLGYPGTAVKLKCHGDLVELDNFKIVQSIEVGLVGAGIGEGFPSASE